MSRVRQIKEACKGLWVIPQNRHFVTICTFSQLLNNLCKLAHNYLDELKLVIKYGANGIAENISM